MITVKELKLNKELAQICKENDVKYLAVFGSVANGNVGKDSDMDFVVKFMGERNLFKIVRLSNILSELFQKKVDLVTEDSLNKYIKKNVENEMEIIYIA